MSTARDVALALAGRRAQRLADGFYLIPCPVPSHGKGRGDRSPSLRIGDGASRLLVHCYAGCHARDVLDVLRRRGLLDGAPARSPSPSPARSSPPSREGNEAAKQLAKARWLWRSQRPIVGTVAERYLREVRGITGMLPGTLGFLPARDDYPPSLIAAFGIPAEPEPGALTIAPTDVAGVHITRLKSDGLGKDPHEPAKIMIGKSLGWPIVLAPPNDGGGLGIVEGIEDGLSVAAVTGLGVWAAGSASRLPVLAERVPSYVTCCTIFAHDDDAGRNGACTLAAKLRERGLDVAVEGLS